MQRYLAEAMGTFGLVFVATTAALLARAELGVMGLAIATGVAAAAMTMATAAKSGAHLNPAVTMASWASGRTSRRDVGPYLFAQLAGGVAASAAATSLALDRPGASIEIVQGVAAGFGRASPAAYGMTAALLAMAALGALLAFAVLGASTATPPARALTAGFAYSMAAFVGLPVANAVANPAAALGPALLAGGPAIEQLWVFLVAPVAGALAIGVAARRAFSADSRETAPAASTAASSPR